MLGTQYTALGREESALFLSTKTQISCMFYVFVYLQDTIFSVLINVIFTFQSAFPPFIFNK